MADPDTIRIELVYATRDQQHLLELEVPAGTTVTEALHGSGMGDLLGQSGVGVFGRLVDADHVLQAGERVEICRPLVVDPKEARRRRAAASRSKSPRR
jgi:putative ubiquitin-RnfH superfamily antitoxin RatB of RatAB toxin-antitoxin module